MAGQAEGDARPACLATARFTGAALQGGGFRWGKDSLLKAANASLQRLQLDSVPLYQVPTSCSRRLGAALPRSSLC